MIALDTGGYASGSGTFYPVFNGNASAKFFADANYDAYGLSFRDFMPGHEALASYLGRVRQLNPSTPPAVITNINLTADPLLTRC